MTRCQTVRRWVVAAVLLGMLWPVVRAQANPDKVHVLVIFSRYNARDERLTQFDSLYIVTRIDNRWGIRSRSSFAE